MPAPVQQCSRYWATILFHQNNFGALDNILRSSCKWTDTHVTGVLTTNEKSTVARTAPDVHVQWSFHQKRLFRANRHMTTD